jgi:Uma2 family endonuclease
MATASKITVEEYLTRDFEPSRELISGELREKPIGTREHMRVEKLLTRLLERFEKRGLGQVLAELSVRRGDDVRIPDLVFYPMSAQFEDDILVDPPLLCVEILSPSQRPSELFAKCEIYHSWEVPYCWVIDPASKSAWEYHRGSPVRLASNDGWLSAGEIGVTPAELFA